MNSRKTGPVPVQQSLWNGKEDPVRDVWTGVLKSALQKHVRRGETDLALPVAAELLKRAKTEFFQRWPVIVAEDVLPGVALISKGSWPPPDRPMRPAVAIGCGWRCR
jgi:hypothetical protein